MSRIENADNVEKGASAEKAPQNLKGESNTTEGLGIIRQEELRRANQHNGDLPEVEIFGGDLAKPNEDAGKRSVAGDGDESQGGEPGEGVKETNELRPTGKNDSEKVVINELADTYRKMSWEADGKANNLLSKDELSRLIDEGETASGRKLTERELKVLNVIRDNYDDLNALSGSTDPVALKEKGKVEELNQLSDGDFDRLQQIQKELDARREMAEYFSHDDNFKKMENIVDDYSSYYGEPKGFISYADMLAGSPDDFSAQDYRMLQETGKRSMALAAAKADGNEYTRDMVSQADFAQYRDDYSNAKPSYNSHRTTGVLLHDLETQMTY